MTSRSRNFLLLAGLITLAAAGFRAAGLWNALEYDELWSLESYAPQSWGRILTDLSLPNNHPLNSMWLKITADFNSRPILRLHSFLAGLGTILAAGWLALRRFRNRKAVLWVMACLAVSSPLISAGFSARGYSLQTFFITLFAAGLTAMKQPRRCRYLPEALVLISGIGAIWTLNSSALFLFPVTAAALYYGGMRWKRGDRDLAGLAVLGCFGLFTLCWYGKFWTVMQGAQDWAAPVTGCGMFLRGVAGDLCELGFPLWCFLAALLWRRNRVIGLIAAFPLLAAVWTHLAVSRVYMPLVPAFALMTGYAAMRCRKRGWMIFAVWTLLSFSQWDHWRGNDWYGIFDTARRRPAEELVVYAATAGYPIVKNNPEAKMDFLNRMAAVLPGPRKLLLSGTGKALNGVDDRGREEVIANLPGMIYPPYFAVQLKPLTGLPQKGELLILLIHPVRQDFFRTLLNSMKICGKLWQLNGWFTPPLYQNSQCYRYGLFALKINDPEKWPAEFSRIPPQVLQVYRMEAAR